MGALRGKCSSQKTWGNFSALKNDKIKNNHQGPLISSTKHWERTIDLLTEAFHDFSKAQGNMTSTKQNRL